MTAQTVAVLTQKGVPQDQWATVLNKASLVEREARLPEDRPKVARAIENRLAKEMSLDGRLVGRVRPRQARARA